MYRFTDIRDPQTGILNPDIIRKFGNRAQYPRKRALYVRKRALDVDIDIIG